MEVYNMYKFEGKSRYKKKMGQIEEEWAIYSHYGKDDLNECLRLDYEKMRVQKLVDKDYMDLPVIKPSWCNCP